jgi:hypothetical protein
MKKIKCLDDVPQSLTNSSAIFLERQQANLEIIGSTQNSTAELSFPGYQNQTNKELIRALANGCCAYCGVKVSGEQTLVVEHFRPKKDLKFRQNECRIEGLHLDIDHRTGKFEMLASQKNYGYFKWGDDHLNLFPSCNACNTGEGNNGIYVASDVVKGNLEYKIPYGKKTFFPVFYKKNNDPRRGKQYVASINEEYPLLFNPFEDDPEHLFSYRKRERCADSGQYIVKIRPNPLASKKSRLKAEVTINLLGLNRQNLCYKRARRYEDMRRIRQEITRLQVSTTTPSSPAISELISNFIKLFTIDELGFYGYSRAIGKTLGRDLRNYTNEVLATESAGILSLSNDFNVVFCELKQFLVAYPYNWTDHLDEADDII